MAENGWSATASSSSTKSSSGSKGTKVTALTGEVSPTVQAGYDRVAEGYKQSAAVDEAYQQLQNAINNKPGAFSSPYKDSLRGIYDKISNRPGFSYDINKDAFYQQYKDNYAKQGQKAMTDTVAATSALTGGYGNTYSGTAGQQSYQDYLTKLNDIAPELRQQALEEYQAEGEELYKQANLANTLLQNDYKKYRDAVADYQADRGFYHQNYTSERDFDYRKFNDERNYFSNEYWNQRSAEETTTESEDAWSNSTTDTLSATQTYTPDEEIVQRSSGGRGRSGRGRSRSSRSSYEPLEVNTSYGKAGDFNSGRTAKTIDVPSRNKLISEAQRSRDPEWYLTNLINKKIISVEDACYILDYMDDTKAFYEDNRDRILENNRQKIEEIREARNAGRGVRAGAAINSYLYGGK